MKTKMKDDLEDIPILPPGGDLSYCKHLEPENRVSQNASHFR
jgi:hypothetical protein